MTNNDSDKFIALYNQLDAYMRSKLRSDRYVSHLTLLRDMSQRDRVFLDYFSDLRMFADMRNMLAHNPYKKDADPLLYPHSYITKKYAEIIDLILHPPKALSVAIPASKIFTATLDTSIQELMNTMVQKNYTHVPIMRNDMMIGIFSENTLLSYFVANQEGIILKDATVRDFYEFIPLEKHMNEYFEFIPRNTILSEVDKIFGEGVKEGKRIAVVYIAENGKSSEKILGMITPWDIAMNH